MDKLLPQSHHVIREKRKFLNYTYFSRNPSFQLKAVHLFSFAKKNIPGMKRIDFPTMILDIKGQIFLDTWSKSTRYKVNRAEKENFRISRHPDILKDILFLFQKTADAKGLRGFVPADFNSKPWIECSAVFDADKIVAGHIWLIDRQEKRILLYVNASDHHEENYDASVVGRAHYYLLWKDGLHFQATGIETLDLNGYCTETNDPLLKGVYTWKEGMHGRQENLYQYYPWHVFWLRKFRNMASR